MFCILRCHATSCRNKMLGLSYQYSIHCDGIARLHILHEKFVFGRNIILHGVLNTVILYHKQQFEGSSNGARYIIQDDHAEYMANMWHDNDIERLVDSVLSDADFWGVDLSNLEGFASRIKNDLRALTHHGVITTLQHLQLNKTTA